CWPCGIGRGVSFQPARASLNWLEPSLNWLEPKPDLAVIKSECPEAPESDAGCTHALRRFLVFLQRSLGSSAAPLIATAAHHDKMSSVRRSRFRRWSTANGRHPPRGVVCLPLSRTAQLSPRRAINSRSHDFHSFDRQSPIG